MKKTFIKTGILLTCLSSAALLNSCRDAVEIVQPGELTPDVVLTNVTNMEAFLNGDVYANFETNNEIYLTSVLTDEVKPGKGSGGQEFQLHRFFLDSKEAVTEDIWLQHYKLISRINILLEAAKNVTPSATEQAKYNNILAQARSIRAFAYLELLTYFSVDMKDDNGLGVMVLPGVADTTIKLPRSTNKEVFDAINADLDFAKTILTTRGEDRFHVDLNFIDAVTARMNLYRGKYSEAKAAAQRVVSESGLLLTKATPSTTDTSGAVGTTAWNTEFYGVASSFNPYRNIWNDSSRGEVIFALNRLATGVGFNIGTRYNTNQSNIGGSPMWYVGRNLFNILDSTDGDIRRYAYVDPSSTVDQNYQTSSSPRETDALIVDKYPGKPNAAVRNDLKIFRLSEMYFILAECAVQENNLSQAATYIQAVREARNYKGTATTPAYATKQAALADILKERRVELAFEGHRYIDLKRMAKDAGVTMDRNSTDDEVTVENLPNDSYKYTLPIPFGEKNANPNIVQNPGYID